MQHAERGRVQNRTPIQISRHTIFQSEQHHCRKFFVSFFSHSRIFPFFGDVTIAGEELQILTYARHLWPLSSEGSLACQTYCDTGQPFIMVISQDSWQSHIMPSVWQCNCHYLFLRRKSVAARIRTPNLPLAGQTM